MWLVRKQSTIGLVDNLGTWPVFGVTVGKNGWFLCSFTKVGRVTQKKQPQCSWLAALKHLERKAVSGDWISGWFDPKRTPNLGVWEGSGLVLFEVPQG